MSEIGVMTAKQDDAGNYSARGRIRTVKVRLSFALEPRRGDMRSDRAPTHDIAVKVDDEFVNVGAAWMRQIKRGDMIGKPMFSLSIQDPDLPDWLSNLAAFPTGEIDANGNDVFRIEGSRERSESEQKEAA